MSYLPRDFARNFVATAVTALFASSILFAGCSDDQGQDDTEDGPDTSVADAFVDGTGDAQPRGELGPNESPEGVTFSTWEFYKELSPKELEPPTDETNKYSDEPAAVKLGHYLFYEEEMSPQNDVSCASCHQPDHGFAEPKKLPVNGAKGAEDQPPRHTPSLLNVAYNKWFFWDGRRDSLWSQAILPYEADIEMGGSRLELAHYVYDTPEVREAYESIFGSLPDLSDTDRFPQAGKPLPDQPDSEMNQNWESLSASDKEEVNQIMVNVMKSIAAFEMQLVSFNAPFDKYVDQLRNYPFEPKKRDAISEAAKRGARLFVGPTDCVRCHGGPTLIDGARANAEFANLGLPERDYIPIEDTGRYDAVETLKSTKFNAKGPYSDAPEDSDAVRQLENASVESDHRGAFKIPPLRGVSKTAPYMHGGHFETLEEVLEFYNDPQDEVNVGARHFAVQQLDMEEDDISDLKAFLESLEGEGVPEKYKAQPDSPLLEE